MLGTDGRLYDSNFDFDGDGKLNAYEYSVMDDVVFGHEDTETSEVDELEDELSLAGLDATELEYMDADERREALTNLNVSYQHGKWNVIGIQLRYSGISKQGCTRKTDITVSDTIICHFLIKVADILNFNDTVH